MDAARAQRLRAIFDEAVDRPAAERAAFVRGACEPDGALAREVLSLLRSLEASGDALEVDAAKWFGMEAGKALGGMLGGGDGGAGVADGYLRGVVIGDFRLVRLIGRGGIGAVYEAEQISLKRTVAIKLLQSWTASREARRRFVEEAAILARLSHPGIAQVFAAGSRRLDLSGPDKSLAEGLFSEVESLPWIAMELVEGARTIVDACRGMALDEVLRLFARAADAVHYGHQQGFIHRDLKPANILVNERGEPKVIDFGIARAIGSDRGAATTHEGVVLGSPRYMSPEQCEGRAVLVDTRSDVYALGVVLYEAMTGAGPHGAGEEGVAAQMRAIREEPALDPRRRSGAISTDAAMVVLKALSKAVGERYQSAAELAADLRRVVAREPVQARRRSMAYAAVMFMRRRPVMTALAGLAVLGVIAGFAGITLGLSRERVARVEADRVAWLANLATADSAIRLGDGGAAMRRLEAIPAAFRGWEWNYLRARADTSLRRWDLEESPRLAFISPSGRWAMLHFEGSEAALYDLRSRGVVRRLGGLKLSTIADWNTTVTEWSSDESRVAVATADAIVVIDALSGGVVGRIELEKHEYPIGVAFSPDSRLLAVGMVEHQGVRVYDAATGASVFSRRTDGWTYQPAFTPDGRTLAWSDASSLECVDTTTWAGVASIPTARVTKVEPGAIEASPDGRTVGLSCGTFVQLIDLPTRAVRAELRGHAQRVHSVRFDRTGARLVTTSIDRTVRVWDSASGRLLATLLGHERPTVQASFLAEPGEDGAEIISLDSSWRARTWNIESNGPMRRADLAQCADYVGQLDFMPGGTRLRAAGRNSVVDIDLGSMRAPGGDRRLEGVATCIVPGRDLVLRGLASGRLVLESLGSGGVSWGVDREVATDIVPSPDGGLFALSRLGGGIAIVRASDGLEVGRAAGQGAANHLPAFSPLGGVMLASFSDGSARLIDASGGGVVAELASPGDRGSGKAFSLDGSLLAYCHAAEGVTIAEARGLRPVARINDVGGRVWSVAISPDKSRVAVGAQDRIVHVYELPSGAELLQLRDHTGTVMSLAWSADGRYLASGGYDKRVFVYDSAVGGGAATAK